MRICNFRSEIHPGGAIRGKRNEGRFTEIDGLNILRAKSWRMLAFSARFRGRMKVLVLMDRSIAGEGDHARALVVDSGCVRDGRCGCLALVAPLSGGRTGGSLYASPQGISQAAGMAGGEVYFSGGVAGQAGCSALVELRI